MELFSLDEVNKGISRGINVMPNWDVFKNFEDDSIYNLIKKLNIKYMAAENKIIYSKKKLLKRLSNIIKIYSYGEYKTLDSKKFGSKTEIFTLCYETDFFYGVYVDHLRINQEKIKCNEFYE